MLVGDCTLDGTKISELTNGSEKRVKLKCDKCSKLTETNYHNYILGQIRNGNTGKTQCRGCAIRESAKKRRGKPAWNKGKQLPSEKKGSNSSSWKGGCYIDAHGYVMVHCHNPEAKCKWEHYKKEHVLVMERVVGRQLANGEIVHHIDGDKQNNKAENLTLLVGHQHHRDVHSSLQNIGYELVKRGFIKYDRKSRSYLADLKLREFLEQPEEANQKPSQDGDISEGSTTRERDSSSQ
jgi:hypothetical protein